MADTPEVGFSFGVEGDQSLLSTIQELRTELVSLRTEQDKLGGSAANAARGYESLGDGAAITTRQMREARGELQLVGAEIGTRLPREIRTFVAELPGVGKLLAAAFSVTAIAFLAEQLIELPGKIAKIAQALAGWGAAAQKAYEDQIKLNDEYLRDSEDLEKKVRHAPEANLTGPAKTARELKDAQGDLGQINAEIRDTGNALQDLQSRYAKITSFPTNVKEAFVPTGLEDAPKKIEELQERLRGLINERNELQKVTVPRLQTELAEPDKTAGEKARAEAEIEEQARIAAATRELDSQKSVHEAFAEEDKEAYEKGEISLTEYYARRAEIIKSNAAAELTKISEQRAAEVALLQKLQALPAGQTGAEQAQHLKETGGLTEKITDLDGQANDVRRKSSTDLMQLESERYTAAEEHLRKELELQKEIADLEGNKQKADEAEAKLQDLQITTELRQVGQTDAQIQATLARLREAQTARTAAAGAQQRFESGVPGTQETGVGGLEEKKSALQEQVSQGAIFPLQASQQLKAAYEEQIPLLQKQVDLLRQQAKAIEDAARARGETGPNAEAQSITKQADTDQAKIDALQTQAGKMDATWTNWRTNAVSNIDQVSSHLTTGLNGWIEGHQKFSQAIAQTWNSIVMTAVSSLEKIAAQWIAKHLQMLLIKETTDRAQLASTAETESQGQAIKTEGGLKSILIGAKTAAVHAFKGVYETVPFPVNLILAPAVAAAAFAGALALGAFAEGGFIDANAASPRIVRGTPRHMTSGGRVRGPGTGTSDEVPILASHGEYMVTSKATRAVGADTLDRINTDPEGAAAALHAHGMLKGGLVGHGLRHTATTHVGLGTQKKYIGLSGFAKGGEIVAPGLLQSAKHFADGGPIEHPGGVAALVSASMGAELRQPAPYSAEGLHRYASGGETSIDNSRGGDVHIHSGIDNLSALDGASVVKALEEHGDVVGKIAVRAVKTHFRQAGVNR